MGLVFVIFSIMILQFIGVSILRIPGFGGPWYGSPHRRCMWYRQWSRSRMSWYLQQNDLCKLHGQRRFIYI
jgi:hypothetical protein